VKLLIEARGPEREPIGTLTGWTEAHLVPRHNGVGTWTLAVPFKAVAPEIFQAWGERQHSGVRIVDEDRPAAPPLINGPLTTDADAWGRDQPHDGMLTLSGVSDTTWIARRAIYADPTQPWGDQDPAAFRRVPDAGKTDAETVIRTLALESLGSTALIARRVPGFTAEANLGRGEDVYSRTVCGFPLLDRIQRLAMLGGLGFRVDQDPDGSLVLRFYQPTLKENVLLSPGTGTVLGGSASIEAPTITRALVAGQTSCVEVAATDPEGEWGRFETVIDQRSTTDADDLEQAAAEALASGAARGAWQADVQDGYGAVYGVDYGLGDIVGIDVRGTEVRDVVREVVIDATAEGVRVGPVVGPPDASAAPALYRRVKALEKRLREQGA
jgi:hypothetical protein